MFNLKFNDSLTLDIRDCPHLLIVGNGDHNSELAKYLESQIDALYNDTDEQVMFVCNYPGGCLCDNEGQLVDERYELLSALNLENIRQFNDRFKCENWNYLVILADAPLKSENVDDLKQILAKGRAVGVHMIMFVDNLQDLGENTDLLDWFSVKLVYKVKNANESELLTGYSGAENLKKGEFMLVELGKQPVIYKSKL